MMNERFSDEMLMRFADGELEPDEMDLIEKAMEADDDLVARVAMFIETKAAAQEAMRPMLDEPVPEKLQASVEAMVAARRAEQAPAPAGAEVLPFKPRPPTPAATTSPRWTLPIAASIAAVAGGLFGYWAAGDDARRDNSIAVAGVVDAEVVAALENVPAGQESELASGRFRAIASFRDGAQDLCREFEVDSADRSTIVSVACRSDREWRVTFAVAAPGGTDGYAPASSGEALDAYLSAIEAGEPLAAEEEATALSELRSKTE
jgi:anti-sigma factor RsiW